MKSNQFIVAFNVIAVTAIIGLAISYFTVLIDVIPDINFLEAVGIYALYMPLHHTITSRNDDTEG